MVAYTLNRVVVAFLILLVVSGLTFSLSHLSADPALTIAGEQASDEDIENANKQLKQIFKSLGLGILVILPFSPISIPYVLKKAKEHDIDLIPEWYKALSKDKDRLE